MTGMMIIGICLFIICFVLITLELFNKTIVALLGAVIFIIIGIISQEAAFNEIDWNVIFLLIGMMVIVGITKNSGIFSVILQ